jgi:hypothetical protein
MTVGPREVILDAATLRLAALKAWPDGNIGVLRSGSQYTFFAANSSGIGQTIGTLDNPVATSVAPRLEIYGMKAEYQYAAGGPVYRDEGTGMLLMFYHAEKWIGGDPQRFWSAIGMAKSGDEGRTWWDLGEIVAPHVPAGVHLHEITGGTFAVVGRYFHVYFRDLVRSGSTVETNNLAVARAAVSSVLHAARRDRVASWVKYHDGRWTEPGVGGRSSPLEPGNPASNFMSISYNRFTGTYLLVVVGADDDWDLYVTESPDGLAWSPRVRMEDEPGESYAPTIVGLRAEPRDSDHQFYVYYVFSAAGSWNRWNDAVLARRRITLPGTDRVRQEPPVNRGLPRLFTRESFRKMMSLLSVQATPGYNDQAHSMNCSVTAIPL